MIKLKAIGISIVASTIFGAASCMAQGVIGPTIGAAAPWPVPHATQVKRCQDVGQFVNTAAVARDAGESEQHFIGRLGVNMSPVGGLGLIHQRLPANTLAAGGPALVREVYASSGSPADWQRQLQVICEKNIS
jgi:hypothetical protein